MIIFVTGAAGLSVQILYITTLTSTRKISSSGMMPLPMPGTLKIWPPFRKIRNPDSFSSKETSQIQNRFNRYFPGMISRESSTLRLNPMWTGQFMILRSSSKPISWEPIRSLMPHKQHGERMGRGKRTQPFSRSQPMRSMAHSVRQVSFLRLPLSTHTAPTLQVKQDQISLQKHTMIPLAYLW